VTIAAPPILDDLAAKAADAAAPPDDHPDKGAAVRCVQCSAILNVPDLDWRREKTPQEQYAFLCRAAEARGWRYGPIIFDGQVHGVFRCPVCIPPNEEGLHRLLPRFDPQAVCGACGASGQEIQTRHCSGLAFDCELECVRSHLHRTCGKCGSTWIEGRLDDPKTKDSICTGSSDSTATGIPVVRPKSWFRRFWTAWKSASAK
jgi:hypothetical protein